MLDAVSYQKNIIEIRSKVTGYKIGVVGPREPAKTKTAGYSIFQIIDTDNPLELIYQNHDLYVEGWRNRDGEVFVHSRSGFDMQATKRFRCTNEHGDLGLDRTTAIYISLDNINGALAECYNAKTSAKDDGFKRSFAILAAAFSEAVRFGDVMYQIIKGLPITDLDWAKHKNRDAVMVVKG